MTDWMFLPLRKYAVFTGRARRKEYWLFVLFLVVVAMLARIIDVLLGFGTITTYGYQEGWAAGGVISTTGGWVTLAFHLATLVPWLAVSVRRLHDGNHSAWHLLWMLVPMVGWTVLLVFYILEGTRGSNRFGLDPLEA